MNVKQKEKYEGSLNLTLSLFKQGKSVPEIAYKRKFAFSTIEKHLRDLLEQKRLILHELLDEKKINQVKEAIKNSNSLKEIKEKLPKNITYEEVRYVLSDLGKIKSKKKTPIESAINTYIGNYCYRKCFNHDNILRDCFKKFEQFKKTMGPTQISFNELNNMMKNEEVKICKLPSKDTKRYVSWRYFEHLKSNNTDFWDLGDK